MQCEELELEGIKRITLARYGDDRGWFSERFQAERFAACGITDVFVQDNHSLSLPGVLRGLHFQHSPAQGKLVGVVRGKVWDVAVDIRPQSPSFGRYVAEELSAENATLLWIPQGFAHGFCVLGDEPAEIIYKVSGCYNPQGEGGIRYDDADLAIAWPLSNPIISARDAVLPSFAEYSARSRKG